MTPDKETAAHLRDGEHLRNMMKSDGWMIAIGMLKDRMSILDSVSSIPDNLTFEEIGKEALFRARAISLVNSWLGEIQSRVEQNNDYKQFIAEQQTEVIVRKYSSPT